MTGQLVLQTVHTTGVNWESVAVIVGSLVACLTFLGTVIERRNRQIRSDITGAVTHLGEVLGERLETKANVAALSGRVAVLEAERARRRRWLLGRGALPPPPPVVYAKTYTRGKGNPR